jgi:hypothetical protein
MPRGAKRLSRPPSQDNPEFRRCAMTAAPNQHRRIEMIGRAAVHLGVIPTDVVPAPAEYVRLDCDRLEHSFS